MKTKLYSIVSFLAVAPGATVVTPHGLNVNNGTAVIPDELKRKTSSNFTVSADAINVTVTNNSGVAADIDILCERWHSIERQFGVGGNTDLPIQPWESDDGNIPTQENDVYWIPEAPPAALFSNAFATFAEAHDQCMAMVNAGIPNVKLWPVNTYATDTLTYDPLGPNEATISKVCTVNLRPGDLATDYDMSKIEVINQKNIGDQEGGSLPITWADDVRWINPQSIVGYNMMLIGSSAISSGIELSNVGLRMGGGRQDSFQLSAAAAPLFKCGEGAFFASIFQTGENNFSHVLGVGYDPFGIPPAKGPSLGPIWDTNGAFFCLLQGGDKLTIKDTITDTVGGTFMQVVVKSDDAQMDYRQAGLATSTFAVETNNGSSRQSQSGRRIVHLVGPVAHDGASDLVPDWGVTYLCDTTGGIVAITLPNADVGKGESVHVVNAFGGFNVTLTPQAGETVDIGQLVPGKGAKFESDGSELAGSAGRWVSPTPSAAYAPANVTTDRAFDADTVAIAELADVVGTMIADLQDANILG